MQGFYGWLNKNMKGRKGQQGFTLIELLVVVTILGILAAIVTLSLVGLTTNASAKSCQSEYKTVQSALDAYMANKNLAVLTSAQASWTNDMTGAGGAAPLNGTVQLYNSAPTSTSPNYTRNGVTQFYYEWDVYGRIIAIASNNAGAVVTGCAPN
jgi:prepilin-type N-terminal cleavage/methylation domain-containing protein